MGQSKEDPSYQNGQVGEVRPRQAGRMDQTTNGDADAGETVGMERLDLTEW